MDLRFFAADMDAYVSSGLRHLGLSNCRLTLLPAFSQLSGLTSLSLRGNAFTALPPALAHASSLAHLDLRDMDSMPISTADVDAVLAHSPRMSCLLLSGTENWRDLYQHLWRTAPHVKLSTYLP
ncbi:hypothetical protein ABPG75_011317 [Micractinium tetrahymenae]